MSNLINKLGIGSNVLKNVINQQLRIRNRSYSNEIPIRTERSLNSVTLLGRVGIEPQKRGSDTHPVVTFSLATNTNYKNENGDWMQRTDWHKVVVFKPSLREMVMNYLSKGQRALVNGRITYSDIVDQEGKSRTSTSIIADDIISLRSNEKPDNIDLN